MAPRMPLLPSPSMMLVRRAMVEGLKGESKIWRGVMYAIILRRILRKLMGSDPVSVAIERLQPGETLVLRGVSSRKPPKR
jgi:hypothetical protein